MPQAFANETARIADAASLDAVLAEDDRATLIVLTGDPAKNPEAADIPVIAREIARAHPGRLRLALADRAAEAELAARYAVPTLPAMVFARPGRTLGVIPRVKAWPYYEIKAREFLAAAEESAA